MKFNFCFSYVLANAPLFRVFSYVLVYFIFCSTHNMAFCMVADDNDTASELSSIFDYDDNFIDYSVNSYLPDTRRHFDQAVLSKLTETELQNLNPAEKNISVMFEYLKDKCPQTFEDISTLEEKSNVVTETFFHRDRLGEVLSDSLEKQTTQLHRRHDSLITANLTIKNLTKENQSLHEEIDELTRLLRDALK